MISDLVITPHAKRMLTRNVFLLEQICCAPDGSVRDYTASQVLREPDLRAAGQIEVAAEIQSGALAFATQARDLASRHALQPFAVPAVAARWCAAMLGRLLLLPDDDELDVARWLPT